MDDLRQKLAKRSEYLNKAQTKAPVYRELLENAPKDPVNVDKLIENEKAQIKKGEMPWYKEAGYWLMDNVPSAFRYLDRKVGARSARYLFRDAIYQAKKDFEDGNVLEGALKALVPLGGGQVLAESAKQEGKAKLLDLIKVGQKQISIAKVGWENRRLDDYAGADEFIKIAVGKAGYEKANEYLKKTFNDEQYKIPDKYSDNLILDAAAKATVDPLLKTTSGAMRTGAWLLRNTLPITELVIETAMDPTTFVGFGVPLQVAKKATSGAIKGTMAGLSYIHPNTAKKIEQIADKAAEVYSKARSSFDLKYAAKNEFEKVLGKDWAVAETGKIEEIARSLKRVEVEMAQDLKKGGAPIERATKITNVFRKGREATAKALEPVKLKPIQYLKNKLVQYDDPIRAQESLLNALKTAETESLSLLPAHLSSTVKESLGKMMSDTLDEKEVSRLVGSLNAKTRKVGKYFVRSGFDDVGQVEGRKLVDQFASARMNAKREAKEIVRDRTTVRIAEAKARLEAAREGIKVANQDADNLARQFKIENKIFADKIRLQHAKRIEIETASVKAGYKQSIENTRRYVNRSLEQIKGSPDFAKKKYAIFKLRDQQFKAIKEKYKGRLESITNGLKKERDDIIRSRMMSKEAELTARTKEVLWGLPTDRQLRHTFERTKNQILRESEKELLTFTKQIRQLKFLDQWNTTLNKYKSVHESIFEKNIKDLDQGSQAMARTMRDVFETLGQEEVERGRLNAMLPNYLPRVTKEGPILQFDVDKFGKNYIAEGKGMSKFSQHRKENTFDDFAKSVEKKGGKAQEDPWTILFTRYERSKREQAFETVASSLPPELKTGEAGKKVAEYLDYVFYGRFKGKAQDSGYRWFTSKYSFYNKALLTVFSPTFYFRNLAGYPFLAANTAGKDAFNPQTIAEWVGAKTGVSRKLTNSLGQSLDVDDFLKEMERRNVMIASFSRGDIKNGLDFTLNRFKKSSPRWWVAKALHAAQATEDFGRGYAAYTHWKKGASLDEAAKLAKEAMYTFDNFNAVDRALSGVMSFYSFKRKNLPATVKLLLNDPKQFMTLNRVITNFSEGKPPKEQDLRNMDAWDKDQLAFFVDLTDGVQAAYQLGFTPYEDAFQTLRPLFRGGVKDFIGETIFNNLNGLYKGALDVAHSLAKSKFETTTAKEGMRTLPKEWSALSSKNIEWLNKTAKKLGWDSIVTSEVIRTRGGEPFLDKKIEVPKEMYWLLTQSPLSRVTNDTMKLMNAHRMKTGKKIKTVADMLEAGLFADDEALLNFLTGIKKKEYSWEELRENKFWDQYRKMENELERRNLIKSMKYMPKTTKQKLMEMRRGQSGN